MTISSRAEPLSISQLNLDAQGLLESSFPLIWLQGELSNFSRPASGHWYFSLKDTRAQINGAMFRNRNRLLNFAPQNGEQVLVRAKITLYVPRGNFQIVVEHMEPAGQGALKAQFDALKAQLQSEGLFAQEHKRTLPAWPNQIGVITSPSGAAIRDILQVLQRRCPSIPVLIYPAAVQGAEAPAQLRQALALAVARNECDVLILGRGGGSLEDLWAFNDEGLARAVANCPIPIVSAVGHEVDTGLTDFAADLRAPTPSAAAELVSPDLSIVSQRLAGLHRRLRWVMAQELRTVQERLRHLSQRLRSPRQHLEQSSQRLDELQNRLQRQMQHRLTLLQGRLQPSQQRLARLSPQRLLVERQQRLATLSKRLPQPILRQLQQQQLQLAGLSKRLHTASPLETLARGYSITFKGNQAVRSVEQLQAGDTLTTRLADGEIIARVEHVQVSDTD
ncbi:MAG: exodeoxyribonuclease VII large subunit [Alcanivorax borkumensis]|jgi:exodeoxyribonuclease VII large subunit|uniref:Exodeoxyribonuclease 7 large subunit n=1 Tax=Alcanivorax borkumensis (strain ATCC 700651 / DSM 11573 / NCIMB 13689 / SK2) TaxID=393595 RepID=EX7L_ALCBS|nr:exodeoxyribonuclease VII large subunit [Alcanivorax borkumensis]Q0VNE8.1 RecName: Full=Exodeoxyribonuclease 7 large subunit; AltName: Full=Exodeoxyribonuclease VII large subunit; Short=Exonuclease VII large subunit [Alcanivorax borkumensis SK2]OJH08071.1 MAG: exodeoxyribonuclease VII large subunit [Alcanivorax borkumensis]CAL17300.1 Exodeoxyribonuclease VII, large subunit [Alcanivorax borkumensis SK2]